MLNRISDGLAAWVGVGGTTLAVASHSLDGWHKWAAFAVTLCTLIVVADKAIKKVRGWFGYGPCARKAAAS